MVYIVYKNKNYCACTASVLKTAVNKTERASLLSSLHALLYFKKNNMPWSLLFSFLGTIPGVFGDYFKNKNQIEVQKQNNELELIKQRGDMIRQGIITQGELGQEQIKATKPWFKQLMYCTIIAPIIITCFDHEKGKHIFDSLNIVPEWYIFIVSTISLAIWGINSDKVAGIIEARRAYKLERLKINRQAYFNNKRALKGSLTQQEVDEDNKLLDSLDV